MSEGQPSGRTAEEEARYWAKVTDVAASIPAPTPDQIARVRRLFGFGSIVDEPRARLTEGGRA
jgi:hypothetical protein